MTDRIFAEYAEAYRKKQHPVIPFKPMEKRPSTTGWSEFSDHMPSDQLYDEWFNKKGDHCIGMVMGAEVAPGKRLIGLDVDDDHFERPVLGMISDSPPVKRGKKGCTAFVIRDPPLGPSLLRFDTAGAGGRNWFSCEARGP